jgi:hypothetical protein
MATAFSWKYALLLCIVLMCLLGFRAAQRADAESYPEAATIGQGAPTFQELSERFTVLADAKGAAYAFDVLRIATLPPNTDLHLLGHIVGDELYRQEGIDGVKICTQDFRNACSHAIVIGELNEFGTGDTTIERIREACHLAPGGSGAYTMCFHGLGHGVFAYFGYDLPKAVAFCKRLGTDAYQDQEYTQCVGGIIMELIDGGGHDHDKWVAAGERYLDPQDPLAPCDRTLIPDEVKTFCYMYLTPHLFEAAGADLAAPAPATFPEAFGFCDEIGDDRLRSTCYGSFGKEFVPLAGARDIRRMDMLSDAEYRRAISWCALAPQAEARPACIEQELSSIFWGGENDSQASFRFCGLVSGEREQDACWSGLARNIASYIAGERRERLCAQLPEDYSEQCTQAQVAPQDRP